jgi:hypothetical protein
MSVLRGPEWQRRPPLTGAHQKGRDVSDAYLAVDLQKNFWKQNLGEISGEKWQKSMWYNFLPPELRCGIKM